MVYRNDSLKSALSHFFSFILCLSLNFIKINSTKIITTSKHNAINTMIKEFLNMGRSTRYKTTLKRSSANLSELLNTNLLYPVIIP